VSQHIERRLKAIYSFLQQWLSVLLLLVQNSAWF